jgi:PAS domain S-box-containing protein
MTEPTTDLTSELWGLQPIRDALGRIPGVSVLSISTTGRVVDVLNPAALHRTVAELIEVDVSEWWGPMPADDAEPQKVEWPDPRGDAVFTIELVPVCEREGTRLGTIALTRDITDRLRTAELARAALDAANDGIVIVDDSQRYVEANQAACRLLGYTRAEFLSKTIADVVSPATHRTWESLLADGGTTGHVDLVRADGAVVTAEFGSKAHVVPGRHLSILRDATERLRQEHLLREARALFEGAFDSAPVGMAMIDATPDRRGVFIRVNRAFAALVDSAPERLVGTDSLDLIHPEDRDEISARRGSGRDAALFSTPRVRRGDGSYACTETTTTHVHDADGHVDYMLAVVVDTTERRLGEENLRASEERFRTMVEASGEGVCVFDDRDCVGFVNPRMVEMAGDRSGTPVGGPATRLVVDEDAAALTAALDACRAGPLRAAPAPGEPRGAAGHPLGEPAHLARRPLRRDAGRRHGRVEPGRGRARAGGIEPADARPAAPRGHLAPGRGHRPRLQQPAGRDPQLHRFCRRRAHRPPGPAGRPRPHPRRRRTRGGADPAAADVRPPGGGGARGVRSARAPRRRGGPPATRVVLRRSVVGHPPRHAVHGPRRSPPAGAGAPQPRDQRP